MLNFTLSKRFTSDKHPSTTEADFPFEIPDSWVWVELLELGEIIGGGTPKTADNDNWNNGDIPWITPADMKYISGKYIQKGNRNITLKGLNSSSARLLSKGSIIYSSRAPIGYIAITDNILCTNQGFKSIDLYNKKTADYLYYALIQLTNEIQSRASGTTFKEISGNEFGKTIIPLPPLNEQKRIVAKLEEILPFIDEYDKKEQKLTTLNQQFPEQLKKSILQAAIQGKLVEQDPNDEPASELIKRIQAEKERLISEKKIKKPKVKSEIILRDNLPYEIVDGVERCIADEVPFEIPESWAWVRLGDIGLIQTGNTPSKENKNNYSSNDFPFFKPSDLNQNHNIVNSKEFLSIKGKSIARVIEKDSLLVNGIGNIGQVGILRVEGAFNQQMHSLTPYNEININFLYYFVKSDTIQNQMKSLSSKTTIPIMNKSSFESIIFPLPPFNEQKRIVQKIEELFSYIKHL